MLSDKEISERNGLLIALIAALDVGIHIVDLPHKPKLISNDYKFWLNGYVKNFHLILTPAEVTEEVYLDIRLKPVAKLDIEEIRQKVLEWLVMYEHKRIYTISLEDNSFFLVGFNHHNKILKVNPYPVFSCYDPIIYKSLEQAESTIERFKNYNLKIN